MSDAKTVLRAADPAALKTLFKAAFPSEFTVPTEEKVLIKRLSKHVEHAGAKRLLSELKVVELQELADNLSVDLKDGNKNSKNVLTKRIGEHLLGDKAKPLGDEFGGLSTAAQGAVLELLDISGSGTAKGNATSIVNAIKANGLMILLSNLNGPSLQHIAKGMKLKMKSETQSALLEAITTGKVPAKRESHHTQQKQTLSKKKPDLSGDISEADIHQHYYLDELQEFCREKGLSVSGKKKVLGKRIIDYFNADSDDEKEPKKKKAKTTTTSAKKSPKKGKKATEKKDGEKDSDEKKEGDEKKEETTKKGGKKGGKKATETKSDAKADEADEKKEETPKSPKGGKKSPEKKDAEKEKTPEKAAAKEKDDEKEDTPKSPKGGKKGGNKKK